MIFIIFFFIYLYNIDKVIICNNTYALFVFYISCICCISFAYKFFVITYVYKLTCYLYAIYTCYNCYVYIWVKLNRF